MKVDYCIVEDDGTEKTGSMELASHPHTLRLAVLMAGGFGQKTYYSTGERDAQGRAVFRQRLQ